MPKITNKRYRDLLDRGIMETINEDYITDVLSKIKGKNSSFGKALIIALYYTGARPNEVLDIKCKDIERDKSHIIIRVKGSKGGNARTLYLQYKRPLVKYLYNLSQSMFQEMFLFWPLRSNYINITMSKKGVPKETKVTTGKIKYYFKKWFNDEIPPYFLRHNRFSLMALRGATDADIRNVKGGGSLKYYLHQSVDRAKKNAKIMY